MITKLTYNIAEKLQRAEIAAGRSGERERVVQCDLTPLINDVNAIGVNTAGELTLVRYQGNNNTLLEQSSLLTADTAFDAVRATIAADQKIITDKAAEREAEIVAWLNRNDSDKVRFGKITGDYGLPSDDPRVKNERARLYSIIEAQEKQKEERKAAKEKENQDIEKRKYYQLTEVVQRLGTDSQHERWAAGVMPRSEAIDLIHTDWVAPLIAAGLKPLKNEWHIKQQETEYGITDGDLEETDKKTVTDEQWTFVKKVLAVLPGATQSYYHQHQTGVEEPESCDVLRLSQVIGEYTMECDIII